MKLCAFGQVRDQHVDQPAREDHAVLLLSQLRPQQRLVLEHSHAALHSAAFEQDGSSHRLIGVFLGIAANDFVEILRASPLGSACVWREAQATCVATTPTLTAATGEMIGSLFSNPFD